MNKIFLRFRRKLMIEAFCKAFFMGMLIGASAELIFLIVMHLISYNPGWIWIGCLFAIPFLLSFSTFFGIVYYPTQKRIARRIDESGLEERAGTMLEFRDKNSTIIEMQRTDAVQRIQETKLKQIHFRIAPKIVISCLIVTALSVGSMFVPYNIMNILRAEASSIDKAKAEMLLSLLEALRKETAEADISDGYKGQLYDVFDELEDGLNNAESDFGKAAQMSEAEARIKDILRPETSKEKIGAALKQFDSTAELGLAMVNMDTEALSAAFDKMKSEMFSMKSKEQEVHLKKVSSDIEKSLSMSEVPESDSLYSALNAFANHLSSSAEAALRNENVTGELEEAVANAKKEISSSLDKQKEYVDLLEKLVELLENAKRELMNADYQVWESDYGTEKNPEGETSNPEQDPSETDGSGDNNDPNSENSDAEPGENEDGDSQPSEDDPDQSGGSTEGTIASMREEIFDPTLGNVEYGQVFAAYYAEYIASVSEGKIPENMQGMLEKYFESLNN